MDHPTDDVTPPQEDGFPPERVPWSVAHGLLFFALFILIPAVFAGVGHLVVPASGAGDGFARSMWRRGFQMGVGGACVLLVIYVFLRRRSGGSREACRVIGLRVEAPLRFAAGAVVPLVVGTASLVAWAVGQWVVLNWLKRSPPQQEIVLWFRSLVLGRELGAVVVLVFFAVVAAPVTEELTFRGLLYLPLRARIGRVRAALIVSALFAAIHSHLAGMGHLFILALMFTWLMESTRSLVAPILAHAAHNAFMVGLILYAGG